MASSILSDRFQKCPPALVQHEHLLGFQCHFSCLSTISYMKKICQTFHAGYQGHPQPLQIRVFQKTPSWVRNWRIHSPQFQSEISHALGFFASLKLAAGCWAGCVFTVGSRAMQSHSQLESAAWEVMPHPKDRELPSTIESPGIYENKMNTSTIQFLMHHFITWTHQTSLKRLSPTWSFTCLTLSLEMIGFFIRVIHVISDKKWPLLRTISGPLHEEGHRITNTCHRAANQTVRCCHGLRTSHHVPSMVTL